MDRIGCMSAHSSTTKENNEEGTSWLPPGFRFHPTDEELVTFYLASKIENPNFCDQAISEADLNKSEPWELPGKAKMGEKEWYFYSLKDRKYPTGVRTNRATQAGYWKATGKDREVVVSSQTSLKGKLVGMKKTLVFYQGRAPKGTKSNWVMHEYRAQDALIHSLKSKSSKDEWVLCRVFHKSAGGKKMALADLDFATALMGSNNIHHMDARIAKMAAMLPALTEVPWRSNPTQQATVSFSHLSDQNPPAAAPSNSYSSGQAAPSQACSYVSGQLQNATGQQAGQHQLANLLNSLPSGRSVGDSVFTALYEHYNQQVKAEPLQLQDYRQLQVQQTSANLHVPVNTWAGVQDVNMIQASSSGRLSPDSCASTLEFAPSPHITTFSTYAATTTTTNNNSSMPQYFIPRLPSDLESFWSTDFLHAN